MEWDKARQDKTRRDHTRQDKTRQDRTRHKNSTQDTTRQDNKTQDETRWDKTRQDGTRQDEASRGETQHDTTRRGKTQHDTTWYEHNATRQDQTRRRGHQADKDEAGWKLPANSPMTDSPGSNSKLLWGLWPSCEDCTRKLMLSSVKGSDDQSEDNRPSLAVSVSNLLRNNHTKTIGK